MDIKELEMTAVLALLELGSDEAKKLQDSVGQMIEYFFIMDKVDVKDLKPTTHALQKENRVRPDNAVPYLNTDKLLENAEELEDRFIVIPNVL